MRPRLILLLSLALATLSVSAVSARNTKSDNNVAVAAVAPESNPDIILEQEQVDPSENDQQQQQQQQSDEEEREKSRINIDKANTFGYDPSGRQQMVNIGPQLTSTADGKTHSRGPNGRQRGAVLPHKYIVRLKNGADFSALNIKSRVAAHNRLIRPEQGEESGDAQPSFNAPMEPLQNNDEEDNEQDSRPNRARQIRNHVDHEYDFGIWKGYAGQFTKEMLEELEQNDQVEYVEEDTIMWAWDMPLNDEQVEYSDQDVEEENEDGFEKVDLEQNEIEMDKDMDVKVQDEAFQAQKNEPKGDRHHHHQSTKDSKNNKGEKKNKKDQKQSKKQKQKEHDGEASPGKFSVPDSVPVSPTTLQYQSAKSASWGLTRISERSRDLQQDYSYLPSAGAGVDVYIIDSGVYADHDDFEGRAATVANFVYGEPAVDKAGHGTHVAGIIAGKTYGVAKKARIRAVKVLDADGQGSTAQVLAGINYVIKQVALNRSSMKGPPGSSKVIVNMSLGGLFSRPINDAVRDAVTHYRIPFFVAAGNTGDDACQYSPAGIPETMAVGGTDRDDEIGWYSCVGSCVRIFAPGTAIQSDWIYSKSASHVLDGTSMAAPHVAGVAALFLGAGLQYNTPEDLYADIVNHSTPQAVRGLDENDSDTSSSLVYSKLLSGDELRLNTSGSPKAPAIGGLNSSAKAAPPPDPRRRPSPPFAQILDADHQQQQQNEVQQEQVAKVAVEPLAKEAAHPKKPPTTPHLPTPDPVEGDDVEMDNVEVVEIQTKKEHPLATADDTVTVEPSEHEDYVNFEGFEEYEEYPLHLQPV